MMEDTLSSQGEFGNFKSYRKDKGVAISASDGVVHI